MLIVKPISKNDIKSLSLFVESDKHDNESFRYFNKRNFDVLDNHLVTYLIFIDEVPCGYGHLDKENDIVWLGVSVLTNFQGFGLGKLLMELLIANAKLLKVEEIRLSVDNDNRKAISLYEKNQFQFIKKGNNISFYKRVL